MYIETKVEFQHAEPFQLAREVKLDQVVQPVVDGPVKLVWLVAGQDQHKPGVFRDSRQSIYEHAVRILRKKPFA